MLRRNIVGHTITHANLRPDELLFPGLKGAENGGAVLAQYEKRLVGARVEAVRRHGKYFWVWVARGADRTAVLMHLGMTGRVRLRGVESHLVFMEDLGERKAQTKKRIEKEIDKEIDKDTETTEKVTPTKNPPRSPEWPPRFSKFELALEKNGATADLAFADPRRLGRVRVLWGEGFGSDAQLMAQEPLSRVGPDYSKPAVLPFFARDAPFTSGDPDPDAHGRPRPGYDEFARVVLGRKRPIKALLLDQAVFAGVGNWVGDEILYHAKIHPAEVLAAHIHDAADPRLAALYRSVVYVMEFSVSVEGNMDRFPLSWLMPHRWGKRDKARARTELGEVEFETVGGRTSCYVPAVQRRMGKEGKAATDDTSGVHDAKTLPDVKSNDTNGTNGTKRRRLP